MTAAFENLAEAVLMMELDEEIAAVWQVALNGEAEWLARRVLAFDMSKEAVIREINKPPQTLKEKAFQTILKNRTFHGGILAKGVGFVKNGEAGKGVLSRWYPSTLAKRLRAIDRVKEKMRFEQGDGFELLARCRDDRAVVFFIDPPYTAGGKKAGSRLYTHHQLNHEALFEACAGLKGDFIMTYDDAAEVRELARSHGFQAKPVAMKNTHHAELTELVIGRDLSWMSTFRQAP